MIKFFIAMKVPTKTYQSGKRVTCVNGKPRFYEDGELGALRSKLRGELAKYAPKEKSKKAIRLVVTWCFELNGNKYHGQPKTSKPDTDNLQKLLKDCMTDVGFWEDDAQVYFEHIEKYYSEVPGIRICVEEVEEIA